jgi:hypothetical protein
VAGFQLSGRRHPSPKLPAIISVVSEREQLIANHSGEEDAVAPDDGRRKAWWNGNHPRKVGSGPELDRWLVDFGHARAVWPSKLGPIRSCGFQLSCDSNKQHANLRSIEECLSRANAAMSVV